MDAVAGARRRPLHTLHRWLGLWLGAWFALVGLSGAILVFEDEVDAWLNPLLLTDHRPGPVLSAHSVFDRAETEFPLGHVEKLRPPRAPGEVYRTVIRVAPHMRAESPRVEAMFSPVTGDMLGSREAETIGVTRPYLMKTLYE